MVFACSVFTFHCGEKETFHGWLEMWKVIASVVDSNELQKGIYNVKKTSKWRQICCPIHTIRFVVSFIKSIITLHIVCNVNGY